MLILNQMLKYFKSFILVAVVMLFGCSNVTEDNAPNNGNLNEEFRDSEQVQKDEREFARKRQEMIADGWNDKKITNGVLPNCYNFSPKYSNIDNSLNIIVGGGTDVAIKLMNLENNECIRYVFVHSGTSYKIKKIPEGVYYLKIAYGKDWLSRIVEGRCVGKFIRNPNYEKGDDLFDFNLTKTNEGISIPSYQLHLDVKTSNSSTFESSSISESEFNQ
jgi:hypothetical protein